MKTLKIIFFIAFAFQTFTLEAQNKKKLDSLNRAYKVAKHDTTKLLILLSALIEYRATKPDSALQIGQQLLEKSKAINFPKGEAKALLQIGLNYYERSNFPQAMTCFQQILEIGKKINEPQLMSNTLNNMGRVYKNQGDYPKALLHYQKSLDINEKIQNLRGMAANLNNIGMIHDQQKDLLKALDYFLKSLEVEEKIGNQQGIGISYNNIAEIYQKIKHYDKAITYYQKSLQIHEKMNDKRYLVDAMLNLGTLLRTQKREDEALTYYMKSLKISEEMYPPQKINLVRVYYNLGVFYQKKDCSKVTEYAEKGLKIAQEINLLYEASLLSNLLYAAYKQEGNYQKALAYHEMHKISEDSLFNVQKTTAIANLENKLLLEKKAKAYDLLAKDNELHKINAEKKTQELAIIQKEAEAEHLRHLATIEKDKTKADSLMRMAENAQLQADKMRIKKEAIKMENKAKTLQIEKMQTLMWGASVCLFTVIVFALYIYQSWGKEKMAKNLIAQQKEEIEALNNNLEILVQQRTEKLENRNKQLKEYAFYNAHILRRPVANILGLYQVYVMETDAQEKETLLKHMYTATKELDVVIHEMQDVVHD